MVQPRKVNGKKAKAPQTVESAPTKSAKAKKNMPVKNAVHQKKHDDFFNPSFMKEKKTEAVTNNPNLTKKDLKLIEKIEAKMEYHEIRDEHDEVDKLRQQILAIEEKANMKALKKAEKLASAAAMA